MLAILFLLFSSSFIYSNAADLQFINAVNKFALDQFYKEASTVKPGVNLISSPYSAQCILSLLSLGANGATKTQLQSVLNVQDDNFVNSAFSTSLTELNAFKEVILSIANKLYVKSGFNLDLNFRQNSIDNFYSDIESIDFSQVNDAAANINKWIEDKTNGIFKDVMQPDNKLKEAILVLINAIYFKGNWTTRFEPSLTQSDNFYLGSNKVGKVDLMTITKQFPYAEITDLDAKVLKLPYEGDEMSMIVILPNQVDGISNLEAKLTSQYNLQNIWNSLTSIKTEVYLPKFKFESEYDLTELLKRLGITYIFGGGDLSGLLDPPSNDLYVSSAVQKAFILVDESGTEAGAVTTIGVGVTSVTPTGATFRADHPFLFLLIAKDNTILFVGKYTGSELTITNNGGTTIDPINEENERKKWIKLIKKEIKSLTKDNKEYYTENKSKLENLNRLINKLN